MPKDIRSFFKPAGTVKTTSPRKESPEKNEAIPEKPEIYKKPSPKNEPARRKEAAKPRKRSQSREKAAGKKQNGKKEEDIFIDDDSDGDIVNDTPPRKETKESKKSKKKKARALEIEDEEEEFESLKKRKPALIESSDEGTKPSKSRKKKAKIEESPVEEMKAKKKTKMEESPEVKKAKKKKAMVIDSESEEEVVKEKKPRKPRKKKEEEPLIGVSDDDTPKVDPLKEAFSHAKTPAQPELKKKETPETKKAVSVADFFGTGDVKRTPSVKRKSGTMEEFDDDDFEETLAQIDLENLEQPAKKMKTESSLSEKLATKMATKTLVEDTPVRDKNSNVSKKGTKIESPEKMETETSPLKKMATPPKKEVKKEVEFTTPKEKSKSHESVTPKPKQEQKSPPSKTPATPSSIKPVSTPSSDAKKSGYRAFKSRSGPQALGSKEIPEGAPNCLEGLTFVITGVQESIDRDELKSLLERYGAKVTTGVSKKTSYLITGREAGESKLSKAKQVGTKVIEEDEVFELIRTKPGKVSKYELEAKAQIEKEQKEKEKLEKQQRKRDKTPPPRETSSSVKIDGNSNNNNPGTPTSSKFDSDSQTSELTASPQVSECKPGEELLWVDKYKPKTLKNIIGQQGDKSNAKKLLTWLKCWYKNISSGKKPAFGNRWGDDGSGYRAALLSGPPGVGKTTTAHLVCEEAGFSFIELNASDARSKKTLDSQVSEMLHSKTIDKMFGGGKTEVKAKAPTHCLVMDEVDGMAGNEDRGGMAELIALIKKSAIPVICICNDRQSMKVRSLANHCFDLRFQKPRLEQIKSAMMSLAFKEGLKIPPPALNEIITASNQDVRQVIHNLSMWSATSKAMTFDQAKKDAKSAIKDIKVGPFEVIRKVFAMDEEKSSVIDKADLFFSDYSLEPLFVQENYIQVNPAAAKGDRIQHLSLLAASADSIADGDVISGKIRSSQSWSLLPLQAIASSVRPGDLMRGYMGQQISFPSWLGKNSSTNKNRRLLEEINSHMHLKVSSDRASLNLDYRPFLKNALFKPLLKEDGSGVQETLDVLDAYDLMKEDFESLVELSQWGQDKNEMSQVQSKTKAALTRKYNQSTRHLPYQCGAGMAKVRKSAEPQFDDEGNLVEDDNTQDKDEESDDDIGKISSIKAVKAKAPPKKAAEGKGKGKGKKSK